MVEPTPQERYSHALDLLRIATAPPSTVAASTGRGSWKRRAGQTRPRTRLLRQPRNQVTRPSPGPVFRN